MSKASTQCQRILKHLQTGNTLTVRQMLTDLWINSPTARIKDLRQAGHQIADRWEKTENGNRYKIYSLASPK